MEKHTTSDNRFYIVLATAILALAIGVIGLIVSLQRPMTPGTPTGINSAERLPTSGNMQTTEIDPSAGHGVAESPKKN